MIRTKLNKREKTIEKDLVAGRYQPLDADEFEEIVQSIARRKKDAVLNIRINNEDLKSLKNKAKKLGLAYQTFISEILHRFAA